MSKLFSRPKSPSMPPIVLPPDVDETEEEAKKKKKKQTQTIKTGPMGILARAPVRIKTLLGQ